jgi:hypothetical protein
MSPTKPTSKWVAPEGSLVKINSDEAICVAEGRAGSGGVACYARGRDSVVHGRKFHARVQDPFFAKALALRDVVIFTCTHAGIMR